ncbi:MAG: CBASS oligonucleotide cyclase [Patescibacteria group bacterium]|jgi:hypothetical protein
MQITDTGLYTFLGDRVFLDSDTLEVYRNQANNLKKKLQDYINENPEFQLVKMLNSGSVAKGTALKTINDMDVAVYVRPGKIPDHKVNKMLEYLRDALISVYGDTMTPDQFSIGTHCVRVGFKGTGLDVEVVPVIPNGKPDDRGDVLNNDNGEWVETSIPLHLEFIRERKNLYPQYAEIVRMTKWWRNQRGFKFKSFLIELLWCHMVDAQLVLESRIEAFGKFLRYILSTQLQEKIVFTDYYRRAEVKGDDSPIQVYDPINPKNNVGITITEADRQTIVKEAQLAFDALAMACSAYTKENAVANWQKILGSGFNP